MERIWLAVVNLVEGREEVSFAKVGAAETARIANVRQQK
jgi:hypothetical protein